MFMCCIKYYLFANCRWTCSLPIFFPVSNAVHIILEIAERVWKIGFVSNFSFNIYRFFWNDDNILGWFMVNVQNTVGTLVYFWLNYAFLGFFVGIAIYFSNLLDYSKHLVSIVNDASVERNTDNIKDKYNEIKKALVELIELRIYQQK